MRSLKRALQARLCRACLWLLRSSGVQHIEPSQPAEDRNCPVSLADEDAVRKILVDTTFVLWDAVNNPTRLRPTKQERFRVTIFGSARAKPGSYAYEQVKRVAAGLAADGCDIVTGGGDCPGLNAVIRSVAKAAAHGAGEPSVSSAVTTDCCHLAIFRALDYHALDGLLIRGGTILGTANRR